MPERKIEVIITGDNKSGPAFGALHSDLDKTEKKVGGVGTMLGGLGQMAAIGAVATVAAVAGIGIGLYKLGEQFDSVFDTIRTKTGATGPALDALKADFKAVAADIPADFSVIGPVLADLNVRTGLTGASLQLLSKNIIEMSRLTGTEAAGNVALATRLFGDWSVATENQAGMLDKVFRASQATGIGVDALMGKVVQFGAPLRQMGFGLEESMAMLGKWEKEGVNSELVLGSLRIALGNFARDNVPVREGLMGTIAAVKGAGDASKANALAMEVFGARAGPDMSAAIREGRFELGNLLDTIENSGETILGAARDTEDFAEKWQRFTNRAKIALEPLSSAVFGLAGTILDELGPALDAGIDGFVSFASYIGAVVEDGDTLNDWLTHLPGPLRIVARGFGELVGIGQNVIGMARNLGSRLGDLWQALSGSSRFQTIIHLFGGWAQSIGSVAGALVKGDIGGALNKLWTGIKTWLIPLNKNVFAALGDISGGLFKWLQDGWKAVKWAEVWKTAGDIAGGIWGVALDVVGWVGGAFGKLADKWPDIWKLAGDVWSGLVSAGTAVTDWLGKQWKEIKWLDVWANVTNIFATGLTWAGKAAAWLGETWAAIDWSGVWGAVGNFFQGVANIAGQVADWLGLAWGAITAADWGTIWQNVSGLGAGLILAGLNIVDDLTTWLAGQFGQVPPEKVWGSMKGPPEGMTIEGGEAKPLHMRPELDKGWWANLSDTLGGAIELFGTGIGKALKVAFGVILEAGAWGMEQWTNLMTGPEGKGIGASFMGIWAFIVTDLNPMYVVANALRYFWTGVTRELNIGGEEYTRQLDRWRSAIESKNSALDAAMARNNLLTPLISPEKVFSGIVGEVLPPSLGGAAPAPSPTMTYEERRAEERSQGFALGGSFVVPGIGGIDSQRVAFRATPGERVTIMPPGATTNSRTNINIGGIEVNITAAQDWATIRRMVLREVGDRLDEAQRRAGFGGSIVTTGAFTP